MDIRSYRISKGETQQELADAIGVDRVSIARYESGSRLPPLDKLILIANHYDVSLDALTGRNHQEIVPKPSTIAAHTDAVMTPALERRIQELAEETYRRMSKDR